MGGSTCFRQMWIQEWSLLRVRANSSSRSCKVAPGMPPEGFPLSAVVKHPVGTDLSDGQRKADRPVERHRFTVGNFLCPIAYFACLPGPYRTRTLRGVHGPARAGWVHKRFIERYAQPETGR